MPSSGPMSKVGFRAARFFKLVLERLRAEFGGILLLSFIVFLLFTAPTAVRADYTAVVNQNSVLVTNFQGWGSSLCWWANVVGGYSNRTNYVDLAFSQLKLNIVRYNIGGGENPNPTIMSSNISYRALMQGFEPTTGVWNWNADANQRWVLRAALARGANLVDAFANSPPWWMTVSGSATGASGGTNNLQTTYEVPFATYLATVVSNLVLLDGVHFDYVTPMNEPSGGWKYEGTQEGCHMSTDQQARVINDLRAAVLPTGGPGTAPIGIDAPEDVDEYQSYNDLASYSGTTLANIALFTTHTYGANDVANLKSKAASQNKSLWISEDGESDGTGLTMARRIHDDITGLGVRAWVYWQFVDNAVGWGFLYNPLLASTNSGYTTSYTINEKFYVMGQFSEFIRPGCKIISVNDTNTLAAYNPTNSTLVLVMVNNNSSGFNVTYDLSSFGSLSWQVSATQTASGENMATLSSPVVTNQQFTLAIPAQSVTTFVLTTNIYRPTIINQFPATYTNVFKLYAGQTPTFSLSATGSVPFYYQWISNGVAVAGATNAGYVPANMPSSGPISFDCIVSNAAGTATSMVWTVSVVPVPVASYPRAVLALNPIAYWRLNEAESGGGDNGVIAEDLVGGNNGIYANVLLGQPGYDALTDPTETSATFGSILPTNCAVAQIGNIDFGVPTGSNAAFSVVAWVNGTGYSQHLNAGIVTKGYLYGEEFTLDEGSLGGDFRFAVRNAAGIICSAFTTINANINGSWHHLIGVCDEANSSVLLYVDGVLAGSATIPSASGIFTVTLPITIGAKASSSGSGNNQQFFGWINDVAIYNYALNSNQVQTVYQAGISLPPAGLTLTNMSGNKAILNWNYGTLQSATNVAGPYSDITNITQPFLIPSTNAQQFYRVREN